MDKRPHPLVLGGLIAAMTACWSLNFIVAKAGLRHMPALTLATFRVELATLILLTLYAISALRRRGQGALPGESSPRRFLIERRTLWTFVRLGFFGVALNQVCFTIGLSYTVVSHSSLIIGMGPIFVLLLARLQRLEALTPKKILGMAAAFGGVAVLAAEHGVSLHSATLRGDFITFVGSIGFALYTVFSKKVAQEYDSVTMNAANFLFGGLIVLPLAVRQGALLAAQPSGWGSLGWQGWGAIVFMALFASVIAYLIYFWALRYMTASRIATLSYFQPVATTAMGIAWLGEHFTRSLLLGGALILAGVYIIESARPESLTVSG